MNDSAIDFETRKAAARWARGVSREDPTTPDHAGRLAVARAMLEAISPRVPEQDSPLSNVVFLVRTFVAPADPESGPTQAEVEATVDEAMKVLVAVGAYGAGV